jgi:hypothetical protein
MKIIFKSTPPDIIKYVADVAEERNLACWWSPPDTLVIHGNGGAALELDSIGTKVNLYFFKDYNDFDKDISWCEELDLTSPTSIDIILKWLNECL